MDNPIPIFSSEYSIGKSILTLDEIAEIEPSKPVSIFSIVKTYGLKEFYLLDKSFSGFIKAYLGAKTLGVPLRFGLQLMVCKDMSVKDDDSLYTESKVNIWILNNEGYKDLVRISSKASIDGFYYIPRIDWKTLNEMMTKNLKVTIPFYDSFLHRNNLQRGESSPLFHSFEPVFEESAAEVSYDGILGNLLKNYLATTNFKSVKTHPIFYHKESDFKVYNVFRCIGKRSNFNKPNLDHFSSDKFSFESWQKLCT